MDISKIEYIYYRGISTDCNYDCSYCILKKSKDYNKWDDQRYLYKFVNYVRKTKFKKPVSIMFTPHGEVIGKEHYYKAIAKLTQCDHVDMVACQTNGSFLVQDFLDKMKEQEANLKKIALWMTFHPEVLGLKLYDFVNKVIELSSRVNVSMGAVGVREWGNDIVILHNVLPPRIYYWINRPQGEKTKQLNELFQRIDENYHYENANYKCDLKTCSAGVTSLLVKEKGDVYMCHRSKKSIGNLYDDIEIKREKSATRCDCYLTYSQKLDIGYPSNIHKFRFKKEI